MSERHIEDILAEAIYILMPTSSEATQHGLLKAMIPALDRHQIRADEVEAVIGSIIADGVRASLLTAEVMKRVQSKRAIKHVPANRTSSREWAIDQEAQRRRGEARTKAEIDDAFQWEQQARHDAGLSTFTGFQSCRRGFSVEALHKLSRHPVYYRMAKELGWATLEMFAEVDLLNQRGVAPPANPVPAPLPASNRGDGPLTRAELDAMPDETASLGIKYGYLRRDGGKLVEVAQ